MERKRGVLRENMRNELKYEPGEREHRDPTVKFQSRKYLLFHFLRFGERRKKRRKVNAPTIPTIFRKNFDSTG